MKFGQLIGYNMSNIFLVKLYLKWGGKTIPRFFSKKSNISGPVVENLAQFIFIVCRIEGYQSIWKLSYWPLSVTSCKAFLKNKTRSGISFLASFSAWFLKKILLFWYSINWPNHWQVTLTPRDIRQCLYFNCLLTRLRRHKF